jgi:hypothetical protein
LTSRSLEAERKAGWTLEKNSTAASRALPGCNDTARRANSASGNAGAASVGSPPPPPLIFLPPWRVVAVAAREEKGEEGEDEEDEEDEKEPPSEFG